MSASPFSLRSLFGTASVASLLLFSAGQGLAQPKPSSDPASLEELFGAEEPPAPKVTAPPLAPAATAKAPVSAAPAAPTKEKEEDDLDALFAEPAATPPAAKEAPKVTPPADTAVAKPAATPPTPAPPAALPPAPAAPTGGADDLDALFQDLPAPTAPKAEPPAKPAPTLAEPVKQAPAVPAPKIEDVLPKETPAAEKPLLPSELLEQSEEVLAPAAPKEEALPLAKDEKKPDDLESLQPQEAVKKPAKPAWVAGSEGEEDELSDVPSGEEEMQRSPIGGDVLPALEKDRGAPIAETPKPLPPVALPSAPIAPMPAPAYAGSQILVPFPAFQSQLPRDTEPYIERTTASLMGSNSIEILGYANWTANGSLEASKRLSQSRADTIRRYLIAKGIPATKITAKGMGLDFKGGVPRDRVEITAR